MLSCPSAIHVADFNNCLLRYNGRNGGLTGLFVASNPTAALSAFVRSSGTWSRSCDGKGTCIWTGGTLTAVKADGTPLLVDADLTTVDQGLFAQMRVASAVSAIIPAPTEYGGSYINSSGADEDTNSAISYVLYITRAVNPNSIPLETIVTVKWADGTTAQYVRTSTTGSYQWAYKAGSARDAQGRPINPDGTLGANPHNTGSGGGSDSVVVTPTGGYNWDFNLSGGSSCTGIVTVTDGDGSYSGFTVFFPC